MDQAVPKLLSQVQTLGDKFSSSKDVQTRAELRKAVAKLSLALEEPGDILERVTMQVMALFEQTRII